MCAAMSAVHCWAQAWQGAALDALAAWLSEDASRVEPRLAQREACQRFVALFAAYAPAGDSEALSRLLKPFLRILRHSKRITVRLARSGFWEGWLVAQAGRPGSSYITLNCVCCGCNTLLKAEVRIAGRIWQACTLFSWHSIRGVASACIHSGLRQNRWRWARAA